MIRFAFALSILLSPTLLIIKSHAADEHPLKNTLNTLKTFKQNDKDPIAVGLEWHLNNNRIKGEQREFHNLSTIATTYNTKKRKKTIEKLQEEFITYLKGQQKNKTWSDFFAEITNYSLHHNGLFAGTLKYLVKSFDKKTSKIPGFSALDKNSQKFIALYLLATGSEKTQIDKKLAAEVLKAASQSTSQILFNSDGTQANTYLGITARMLNSKSVDVKAYQGLAKAVKEHHKPPLKEKK